MLATGFVFQRGGITVMPVLCNCRGISGRKLEEFLTDEGRPVKVKEAMEACGNGGACCQAHAKSCVAEVKKVVEQHNERFTPQPPATQPASSPAP